VSTLVVYSDTTDGHLLSISGTDDDEGGGTAGTYAAARAGTGDGGIYALTALASLRIGQAKFVNPAGFTFEVYEAFLAFDTSSVGSGSTVSAAVLNLTSQSDQSTTDFTIEARLYDWGTGLTTADWQSAPSGTLLAHRDTASGWTAATAYDLTDDAFAANVSKTGTTRLLLCSSRTTAGTSPTTDVGESVIAYSADQTGTTSDPKLTVTYAAGGGTLFLMLEDNSGSYELEDGSGGTKLEN